MPSFGRFDGGALAGSESSPAATTGEAKRISAPANFRWRTLPLNLFRSAAGEILTDFIPEDFQPPVTNTWFVDPINGNDVSGVVNNRNLPLRTLSAALQKADVDQIRIINMANDFFARTSAGWNNVQPTRSVSVINEGPGRFISINSGSAVLPVWAVNGTFNNVYSTNIAANSATGVTDLITRVNHPGIMVMTNKAAAVLAAVARPFRTLKKVASLAAVAAEAGTFFHDGAALHVRAHDDRNLVGDQFMQPTSNSNNGRFTANVNNLTILAKGIGFVGGRPFYATVAEAAAPTGCTLVLVDCTLQGGGLANGLGIEFNMNVILYRCGAFFNWNDGMNYHCPTAPAAGGLATSPNVVEIECVAYGNGTTGSTAASDNASTAHEYTNILRVNCVYPDSSDRVVVDIDNVNSWILGGYIGQASTVAAGKESFAALNQARAWLDSVAIPAGSNAQLAVDTNALVKQYNCGALANASGYTGVVADYIG